MPTMYFVPTNARLLSHFPQPQLLVRDRTDSDDPEMAELSIRARVRSGDYFIALATELDKLAQGLAMARAPEAVDIERIVSELLYVNENYRLDHK